MFKPTPKDKFMVLRIASEDVKMITDLLRDRMSVVGVMTPLLYQTITAEQVEPKKTSQRVGISDTAVESVKNLFTSDRVYVRSNLIRSSHLSRTAVDRAIRVMIEQKFIRRVAGGHFVKVKSTDAIAIDSAAREQKHTLIESLRDSLPKLAGLELENARSILEQWSRKHFLTRPQWQLVHILLTYARTGRGSGSVAA